MKLRLQRITKQNYNILPQESTQLNVNLSNWQLHAN